MTTTDTAAVACHCRFISGDFLMPGWSCCRCSVYNGLQRTRCRGCDHPKPTNAALAVPADVALCPECGFGNDRGRPVLVPCPVCGWVPSEAKN